MIALIVTVLIDTAIVKIYDVVDKNFIPLQPKLILFSLNSLSCVLLQFFILKQLWSSFKSDRFSRRLHTKLIYAISLGALCSLGVLIGVLIFQLFYFQYYTTLITIYITTISYGISAAFIVWLSFLFFFWYRSSHNKIILLYFLSMLIISSNLIITAISTSVKVTYRPELRGPYVGGGGDISGSRGVLLDNLLRITSFMSFISIWLTTAILMNSYREKKIHTVAYWILLSMPLIYFVVTYFYQFILARTLISYVEIDPVTVSIILSAFLSLSKPIGGLLFGIAFWNISKVVSYEKNIRTFMIISGWGFFLVFAANQASVQMLTPYPPFGLATLTVLNIAGYLMLLGIYNSAALVSANNNLRKTIRKHALESRLLDLIGHAEMEREIQKTVSNIIRSQDSIDIVKETEFELDENELKRYLDIVIKEVKMKGTNDSP
jgi:MFS family permease